MPSAPQPRFLAAGDTALVVEFGDRVDAHLSALVLALAQKLEASTPAGVVEVVPTFRSLMVHYDPLRLGHADLQHAIAPLLQGLEAAEIAGRRWRIPACYDESLGLDLADVCRAHRTDRRPRRRAPQLDQPARLHDGLPAGTALSRRPAARSSSCRGARTRA